MTTVAVLFVCALAAQTPVDEPSLPEAPPQSSATATTTTTTTTIATASTTPTPPRDDSWTGNARFFGGGRTAIGFAPGALGPAGTLGVELGVAARSGLGFGLHVFGTANPPGVPLLSLPRALYGVGAAADVRWYLQTIEPLTLYPSLSLGFLAGPDAVTGANAVLPLVNPGFGARVRFGEVYVALELGAASFYIPFVALSAGWEPG